MTSGLVGAAAPAVPVGGVLRRRVARSEGEGKPDGQGSDEHLRVHVARPSQGAGGGAPLPGVAGPAGPRDRSTTAGRRPDGGAISRTTMWTPDGVRSHSSDPSRGVPQAGTCSTPPLGRRIIGAMPALDHLRRPEYPRSAAYDARWLVDLDMGPHPLWLLEDLAGDLDLHRGCACSTSAPGSARRRSSSPASSASTSWPPTCGSTPARPAPSSRRRAWPTASCRCASTRTPCPSARAASTRSSASTRGSTSAPARTTRPTSPVSSGPAASSASPPPP